MYGALEIQGIPHCLLIDPNGIVRWEGYPILTGFMLTSKVIQDIIDNYKSQETTTDKLK